MGKGLMIGTAFAALLASGYASAAARTNEYRIQNKCSYPVRALLHVVYAARGWRTYGGILREVETRRLGNLALPVLGGVHGKLPVARFLVLLRAALEVARPSCLKRLWVVAAPGTEGEMRRSLGEITANGGD